MAVIGETDISISTIRDALNGAGGSVGNDLTSFFSKAAQIDWWSRYKPLVFGLNFINLWDKRSDTMYYYQGEDGKCGLSYTVYTEIETFKKALEEGKTGWSYTPPTGGESAPMRLGDFRRYCTDAINPVGAIPASLIATRSGNSDSVQIDVEVAVPTGTTHNLGISDFSAGSDLPFANMYLGVYLIKGSSKRFITSSKTIGTNGTLSMTFPLNYGEGGTYTAYTFLSSSIQDGITAKEGRFVSIGGNVMDGAGQTITIKAAGSTYTIYAEITATPSTKNYDYFVQIKNNSGSAQTFKNVKLQIVRKINGEWSNEGLPLLLADSVSVPTTGKTFTGSGTHSVVFNTADLNALKFGVYAYSETPNEIGDVNIVEGVVIE